MKLRTKHVFNREALTYSGTVTASLAVFFAVGLGVNDGDVLFAPFGALMAGSTFHLGLATGLDLASRNRTPAERDAGSRPDPML